VDFSLVLGSQTIDTNTGVNTWTNSTGAKDAYLIKSVPDSWLASRMDALTNVNFAGSPFASNWGTAPTILNIKGV
jgi:hypothetical protein